MSGAEEARGDQSDEVEDEEAAEHVPKEEFLLLAEAMLARGQEQQGMLQQALQRG